jgi:mRNA-degrading endonuclease RelE of RelBE toxin-antitoxin system
MNTFSGCAPCCFVHGDDAERQHLSVCTGIRRNLARAAAKISFSHPLPGTGRRRDRRDLEKDAKKISAYYEKLVGDLSGAYSRRVNIQHRLVYEVNENEKTVKIIRMWTHVENWRV